MRLEGASELCVLSDDRLEFIVSASQISSFLARFDSPDFANRLSLLSFYAQSKFDFNPDIPFSFPSPRTVLSTASLREVEFCFNEDPNAHIVAVCDEYGRYQGVINRLDLSAALTKSLAPVKMGGMATPLGVYLTDGVHGAGAGSLGLILTGVCMTLMILLCYAVMNLLDRFVFYHFHYDAYRRLTDILGNQYAADLYSIAPVLLLFVMMRLTPLAGYHAAEHQVVNCAEQGQPLTIENVRKMSRVHPRCGTNFTMWFLLLSFGLLFFSYAFSSVVAAAMPAILLSMVLWRRLGALTQSLFTTRPASVKQLRSGIKAAEDLKLLYRSCISVKATPLTRIRSSGLLHLLFGSMLIYGVLKLIELLFPALQNYIPL
jgi:hypothetical protein